MLGPDLSAVTAAIRSAVADNQRVDAPSGRVLAFDARTGKQLWEFGPVPRSPAGPGAGNSPLGPSLPAT